MDDNLEIPTSPFSAATWLIEQTNEVFEESGDDAGNANLFFVTAYESIKQSLSNDDKRALFVLALSQDLKAAQLTWYTEKAPTD